MFETFVITFREGLEAFLIVAIMLAYLTKTGRRHLAKPVYAGVAFALLVCATTGWHVAELADTPAMEGGLAMFAGVLVASMTYYVMKTAGQIRHSITNTMDTHAAKTGIGAVTGIFIFTVLMIAREGMETALMLGAISAQVQNTHMLAGAMAGIALTALIGIMWVKQSHRINLKLFMQVTGVFLILFSVHLFLYGVYELTEVENSVFYNEALHNAIRPFASTKTPFGQAVVYSLLIVPCAWLFFAYLRDKFFRPRLPEAAE
jgi:high-affinity iron transporter